MSMNARTQCFGVTMKGARCKRQLRNGQYCTSHIHQAQEVQPHSRVRRTLRRRLHMNDTEETKEEETKEDETKEEEEEEANGELECKCCCSVIDISAANFISCNRRRKQHAVCEDCVKGHIQSNLNQGVATCRCMFDPSEKCGGVYLRSELFSMLPPETVERFEDALQVCEVAEISKQNDNFHICPHCSKYGVIVTNEYDSLLTCQHPACGKSWCVKCRQEHAVGKSCLKFTRAFTPESIASFISFQMSNAVLHKCPRCFTSFMKEDEGSNGDGCNAMTCPKCHTHSCYLCNAKLPNQDYYRHFKGASAPASDRRCLLFNAYGLNAGNKKHHEMRIAKACIRMLLENTDNIQVLKEMVKQCVDTHKVLTVNQLPREIKVKLNNQQNDQAQNQPQVPLVTFYRRAMSMIASAFQWRRP